MEVTYLLISSGPYPADGYNILSAGTKQQMEGLKRDLEKEMESYKEHHFNSETKKVSVRQDESSDYPAPSLKVKEVPVNRQVEDIKRSGLMDSLLTDSIRV